MMKVERLVWKQTVYGSDEHGDLTQILTMLALAALLVAVAFAALESVCG